MLKPLDVDVGCNGFYSVKCDVTVRLEGLSQMSASELELVVTARLNQAAVSVQRHHNLLAAKCLFDAMKLMQISALWQPSSTSVATQPPQAAYVTTTNNCITICFRQIFMICRTRVQKCYSVGIFSIIAVKFATTVGPPKLDFILVSYYIDCLPYLTIHYCLLFMCCLQLDNEK